MIRRKHEKTQTLVKSRHNRQHVEVGMSVVVCTRGIANEENVRA